MLISGRLLSDLRNLARSLCQKIHILKKKMKRPFQTWYNRYWISFSCCSNDNWFRKINKVDIWSGKKGCFFAEKPTYQGAIALSYSLMILVQNFMLINNHLKTWVWKSTVMKLLTLKAFKILESHHKEMHAEHHHSTTMFKNILNAKDLFMH